MATSVDRKLRQKARKVGKTYIARQVMAMNGLSLKNKSFDECARWAKSHAEIIPAAIRSELLRMGGKALCQHLGEYLQRGRTISAANTKAIRKVAAKSFYSSWEWKKVRFQVLKKYGPKCMLCGSENRIVVDHIKPRSKFPSLELDPQNLQVLCDDCNMGKSNDDYTDFRPAGGMLTDAEYDELKIVSQAKGVMH
jgi:5-methylcytosine-specific restriction endonuclease McrA